MKHFQVMAAGKPIFFFEVAEQFADDGLTDRNAELAGHLAEALEVTAHGPKFVPQLISKIPLVLQDKDPDHGQEGLRAWVSPKLNR